MKLTVLSLLLIFLSTPAWSASPCDDASVEVCYNVETGSGEALDDQSSNSNNGVFKGVGEPAWEASDVPDSGDGFLGTTTKSIYFDGVDDYVKFTDIDPVNDYSIVLWGKYDFGWDSWANVIGEPAGSGWSGPYYDWGVNRSTNSEDARIMIAVSNSSYEAKAVNFWQGNSGAWHHYAFTRSGADAIFYIDGAKFGSTIAINSGNIDDDNQPPTIGSRSSTSNAENYKGYMDEIMVTFAELDATDVNDIYENGLVQVGEEERRRYNIINQ